MKIEIDLRQTILGDQYWNDLCDFFSIPQKDRYSPSSIEGVKERIRTYLNGYVMRRSLVERENGAAFIPPDEVTIEDPVDNSDKKE